MVVFGMILALPGTVIGLPDFTGRFGLTLADRGVFISALFGGLFAGSIASGPFVDRLGYRTSIVTSMAAIAGLLPLFAYADSYAIAVGSVFTVGLMSAALNTAANALSSDLFPSERARRMNGLALAVGVGGLLLPAAIAAARTNGSWRVVIVAGAILSAAIAVTAMRLATEVVSRAPAAPAAMLTLLGRPGVRLFCVLLICAAANEGAFAGWTSTYLAGSGFSSGAATWLLSTHWLGLIVGRALFAGRVDRVKSAAIVRGAVIGAVTLLLMIALPFQAVLFAGPFAAGVAIGIILPTSLALAGEQVAAEPGILFGLLLTMAQVGAMIVHPVIGSIGDVAGLRVGLLVAVVNLLLIAALAWRAGREPR
jgi:fucose permease